MSPPMPSDPPAQPSGSPVDLSPEGRDRLRKRCERDIRRSDRKSVSNHEHDIGVMAKEQLALLDRLDALERVAVASALLVESARNLKYGEHADRFVDLLRSLAALRALSAPAVPKEEKDG